MATFSVKNFATFQHYKDRSPPWIKLYNALLDDYAFAALPDASKAHLLAIWLLASRYDNQIPYDETWVSRRINATEPVKLDILISAGFLVLDQACSVVLASREKDACPEREGESERETESPSLRSGAQITKRKSRALIPEGVPLEADRQWSLDYWLKKGRVDLCNALAEEAEKFRDHHNGKLTASADWSGSWRTWTRNAMKFSNGAHNGRSKPNGKHPTSTDKHLDGIASLIRDIREGGK